MSATNGTGFFEIMIHWDQEIGWVGETDGYVSMEAAQAVIDVTPDDGFERHAQESLEGY